TQDAAAVAGNGFYVLTPCRVLDTRGPDGPSGGPALQSQASRNVPVVGACGVGGGANAVSVIITAVSPSNSGYITLYHGPTGSTMPYASTLNYATTRTLANNAIVTLGADGSMNIFNSGPNAVHFLVDVTGYFK